MTTSVDGISSLKSLAKFTNVRVRESKNDWRMCWTSESYTCSHKKSGHKASRELAIPVTTAGVF